MKQPVDNPTLKTWIALNDVLRTADEDACQKLLLEELDGRKRPTFIRRIHSRLNKIRADKERQELGI